MIVRVPLLALLVVFSGCAGPGPRGQAEPGDDAPTKAAPGVTPAAAQAAAAKESAALAAVMQKVAHAKTDYRIAAADLISVSVYEEAQMSRKVRITANGTLTLPMIGTVKVGGMTLIEAAAAIESKLAKFIVSPQVSLFIEEYGNKTIYVMGEVQKPGSYAIPAESRMTVLQAISTAGGFTDVASQERTRVLRNGQTINVDVRQITVQGLKEMDLVLEPNDVIFVPQSFF